MSSILENQRPELSREKLTEIVRQYHLLLKGLVRPDGNDGLERLHHFESLWLATVAPPLEFSLNDMEHRDHISKAADKRETAMSKRRILNSPF
jgi:hypothetical protein